jgi:hypothetical protein
VGHWGNARKGRRKRSKDFIFIGLGFIASDLKEFEVRSLGLLGLFAFGAPWAKA